MTRRAALGAAPGIAGLVLVALLLGGCAEDAAPPTALDPPPATEVTVFPAARSERIPLDTSIYAEFDTDLDVSSVTPENLFFKIDEARYEADMEWSPAERRLTLHPAQDLQIGRTYTIEFTSRVLRASGEPLFPKGWFWQFSTTSIRPLGTPSPPAGSTAQSPFMRLRWDGTEPAAGTVTYQVFWSTDSLSVAQRSTASVFGDGNRWIPRVRWPDARIYWAVRATNLRTGEVLEGPLWNFTPIPFNAPTTDRVLNALLWGSASSDQSPRCNAVSLPASPTSLTAIKWQLPAQGTRLNWAEWNITLFPNVAAAMTLRAVRANWAGCGLLSPGGPVAVGPPLASARRGAGTGTYVFQSDTLTAFVEAQARDQDLFGFVVEANRTVSFVTLNAADPTAGAMLIRYYP